MVHSFYVASPLVYATWWTDRTMHKSRHEICSRKSSSK